MLLPGQTVPGSGQTTGFPEASDINDGGDILVRSRIGFDDAGLFVWQPQTGLKTIAISGQTTSGGETFNDFLPGGINELGNVAFTAELDGFTGQSGLFRFDSDASTVTQVARLGELVNPAAGNDESRFFRFERPQINEPGDILFIATLFNTPGFSDSGLFVSRNDGSIDEIVRLEDAAPGGGRFSELEDFRVFLNDAGQVAFSADVDVSQTFTPDEEEGIFLFDPRLGVLPVARVGDQLPGGVIENVGLQSPTSNPLDEYSGFNELGQILYSFTLEGGTTGVALWTPPSIDDFLPGDADLDGDVDLADFGVLRGNFGSNNGFFTTGDFNGDGLVSLADFGLLRANFGGSVMQLQALDTWAASVPEPATGLAAILGLATSLRRRRVGEPARKS